MAGNQQPLRLHDMIFNTLVKQGIFRIPMQGKHKKKYRIRVTHHVEHMILERLMPKFLQAVVDDDRTTVIALLDVNPELLLIDPPANLIIESQCTWNKFYAESALKMAAKRKQIEMLKIMLPYLDKLEQANKHGAAQAIEEVLTAWNLQEEIVVPDEYTRYAQSLIEVFSEDTFPNGLKGRFTEKTESALSDLHNHLLPEKAVKLDDYLDPELFLLALYQTYEDEYITFVNREQCDAFCVRVIGLAQSVLSPETAKIFCEGLSYVVAENKKISDRANSLIFYDDVFFYDDVSSYRFYRLDRESLSGLGFNYLIVPGSALCRNATQAWRGLRLWGGTSQYLENLCQTKTGNLGELMRPRSPHRESPRCFIQ